MTQRLLLQYKLESLQQDKQLLLQLQAALDCRQQQAAALQQHIAQLAIAAAAARNANWSNSGVHVAADDEVDPVAMQLVPDKIQQPAADTECLQEQQQQDQGCLPREEAQQQLQEAQQQLAHVQAEVAELQQEHSRQQQRLAGVVERVQQLRPGSRV
jgi:hypothetical protein